MSRSSTTSSSAAGATSSSARAGCCAPIQSRCRPDGTGTPDAWGGLICNNQIASATVQAVSNAEDFDEGISLSNACDTWVMHNSVVSPGGAETFAEIDYRFPSGYPHLLNNLVGVAPLQRDGGNIDPASFTEVYTVRPFRDAAGGGTCARARPRASAPALDRRPRLQRRRRRQSTQSERADPGCIRSASVARWLSRRPRTRDHDAARGIDRVALQAPDLAGGHRAIGDKRRRVIARTLVDDVRRGAAFPWRPQARRPAVKPPPTALRAHTNAACRPAVDLAAQPRPRPAEPQRLAQDAVRVNHEIVARVVRAQ